MECGEHRRFGFLFFAFAPETPFRLSGKTKQTKAAMLAALHRTGDAKSEKGTRAR
jgi:hypothetical protein